MLHLVSTKRKSKSGKSIRFASPLWQESPPFKHSHVLVSHALKFGDFNCPFDQNQSSILKSSFSQDHSCVPISKIFGSIKNKLREVGKENHPPNAISNLCAFAAQAPNHASVLHKAPSTNRMGGIGKKPVNVPTVSSFGKLITWHNNRRSLGYVLVKCLYNGAQSIPRNLVFRQGEKMVQVGHGLYQCMC
jgi:hypothetical protein